mmetsp:Transcript_2967/g.7587  ORF Transcript_2967/g.7587 Transcript_2967/m.7587 type:complete len:535 (+) Transcript_2967:662-2266(+)
MDDEAIPETVERKHVPATEVLVKHHADRIKGDLDNRAPRPVHQEDDNLLGSAVEVLHHVGTVFKDPLVRVWQCSLELLHSLRVLLQPRHQGPNKGPEHLLLDLRHVFDGPPRMSLRILASLNQAQHSHSLGHSLLLQLVLSRTGVERFPRHLDESSSHRGGGESTTPVRHVLRNIHEGSEAERSKQGAQVATVGGLVEEIGTGIHLCGIVCLCPRVDFSQGPVEKALGERSAHAGVDTLPRGFLALDDHARALHCAPKVIIDVKRGVDSLAAGKGHIILGAVGVEVRIIPECAGAQPHVVEAHPAATLEAKVLNDPEGSDAAAHFNFLVATVVFVVSEPQCSNHALNVAEDHPELCRGGLPRSIGNVLGIVVMLQVTNIVRELHDWHRNTLVEPEGEHGHDTKCAYDETDDKDEALKHLPLQVRNHLVGFRCDLFILVGQRNHVGGARDGSEGVVPRLLHRHTVAVAVPLVCPCTRHPTQVPHPSLLLVHVFLVEVKSSTSCRVHPRDIILRKTRLEALVADRESVCIPHKCVA